MSVRRGPRVSSNETGVQLAGPRDRLLHHTNRGATAPLTGRHHPVRHHSPGRFGRRRTRLARGLAPGLGDIGWETVDIAIVASEKTVTMTGFCSPTDRRRMLALIAVTPLVGC